MDIDEFPSVENIPLQGCRICSRKFRLDIIDKHERICQKAVKRKTKIFDSGKMRSNGSDIPFNKTIRPGQIVPIETKDERIIRSENKKNLWRSKHEEFMNNIKSAKAYTVAKSSGKPLPPPPPPSKTFNEDFVQCEYCQRRFNERAADRHIPFCREKQAQQIIKAPSNRKLVLGASKNVKDEPTPPRQTRSSSKVSSHRDPSPTRMPSKKGTRESLPQQIKSGNRAVRAPSSGPRELETSLNTRSQQRGLDRPGRPLSNARLPPSPVQTPPQKLAAGRTPVRTLANSTMPSSPSHRTSTAGSRGRLTPSKNGDSSQISEGRSMNPHRGPLPGRDGSRDRYSNYDSGYLHDKPHRQDEFDRSQTSPQPSCDYQWHDKQAFIESTRQMTVSTLEHSSRSGSRCQLQSMGVLQIHESKGFKSRDSGRPSEIYYKTNGSTRNVSPELSVPTSPVLSHGKALRSGRTYQDYVDAQAFAKDLTETRPLLVLNDYDRHRILELKPVHQRPGTSSRSIISDFLLPNQMVPQLNTNQYDYLSAPPSAKQKAFASGIPVRATNVQVKRTVQPTHGGKQASGRSIPRIASGGTTNGNKQFCLDCGSRFPNGNARFCPDCGVRRLAV